MARFSSASNWRLRLLGVMGVPLVEQKSRPAAFQPLGLTSGCAYPTARSKTSS